METAYPTDDLTTPSQPSSVTVVAHGLNTKPEVMAPLIEWLRQQGSEAFAAQLYGHYEGSKAFSGLGKGDWEAELNAAYYKAVRRAGELGVPVYFLGFSLGALVGQYAMFNSEGKVQFDKQVLLAPAIAIRNRSCLLKVTFFLPGHWLLPSKAPKAYRANRGTSIQAYKILFRQQKTIREGQFRHLNIPTLIVIDPKDELISLSKLKKYMGRYGLDNYRILELDSKGVAIYHHLIVDERSMGTKNWKGAIAAIKAHLFEGQ